MKKSNLVALTALVGFAATLGATNLKLKTEYNKGSLKSTYITTEVPAFHFIICSIDSTSRNDGTFEISVDEKNKPGVATYYGEKARFVFKVMNDTLYVNNNPLDTDKERTNTSIRIKGAGLKGLTANRGYFKVNIAQTDSFFVSTEGKTDMNLALKRVNAVHLKASDNSSITLSSENSINSFSLELLDKSKFTAKEITVKDKKIQFSKNASLQFSGRALESLGLLNN